MLLTFTPNFEVKTKEMKEMKVTERKKINLSLLSLLSFSQYKEG
jgi:hypothetical protein